MNPTITDLSHKIRALEEELEIQLALARADLHLCIEDGKIEFEKAVLRRHREMKVRLSHYVLGARPLIVLTTPLIYSLIFPLVLLDVFITIYQAACFPVYDIPKVSRRDYFIFDRRYLAYLNVLEKFNCAFCSYGNGLLGYAREIASRTEQYWCPIKHARKVLGAHPRYSEFSDFGDVMGYRDGVAALNERVKKDRKKRP